MSKELSAALDGSNPSEAISETNPAADGRAAQRFQIGDNPFQRLQACAYIPELLSSVIEASCADFGNVQLFDSQDLILRMAAQHGFEGEFLSYFDTVRCDDDCACGAAMSGGSRVVVSNVATDPVVGDSASRDVLLRANVHSVQSTPLIGRSGKLIGVLSTHYRRVMGPTPLMLKRIDDQAATFVGKVEALDDLISD